MNEEVNRSIQQKKSIKACIQTCRRPQGVLIQAIATRKNGPLEAVRLRQTVTSMIEPEVERLDGSMR